MRDYPADPVATQGMVRTGDVTVPIVPAVTVTTPPAVVAVVVLHDTGPWLEEALAGLAAQDYPNLSYLLVDAASGDDSLARARAVLPGAYVRRLDHNPGFGGAANAVLDAVEGAAFYAFLHDDISLDPPALRLLVEEAFRSNAGVVGPKLVDWDTPTELLQVGLAVDKGGGAAPLVERGELDQAQHDAVRDVFAVPGGCTLVRADLFEALGGFDAAISVLGEDVDLCWRAQVAGARVLVVPAARARHREALSEREGRGDRRHLVDRHRLRSVLSCYGFLHLARVLPQVLVSTLGQAGYALLCGRPGRAGALFGAWTWNLRRLGEVAERRRTLRSLRRLPDREVRRLQLSDGVRLRAVVGGGVGREVRSSLAGVGRELTVSLRTRERRLALAAWAVVALVLLVGSRQLITGGIRAVGGFAPFDDTAVDLLDAYLRGGTDIGTAPPTAHALLGLGGLVLGGAMGLLRLVVIVGCLPLGMLGAWRLCGPLGHRSRLVALVVYATVALPFTSLAEGSWGGLVLYAAAPWLLSRLAAATGEAPFDRDRPSGFWHQVLGLALVTAVAGAFVPAVVLLVPAAALVMALASLVTGGAAGGLRALAVAVVASCSAALLHLPWSLELGDWTRLGGVGPAGTTGGADGGIALVRFVSGPGVLAPLGWVVFVAAALALFIGRDWRLRWAGRAWFVALSSVLLAEAAARQLLPMPVPTGDVLIAFAAAALALAAALGMAAFQQDLRNYRFGWRQVASLVAAVAAVVGVSPLLAKALEGRWETPGSDFDRTLAFLDGARSDDGFVVLWVGDPDVLPLAGSPLADEVSVATSANGAPGVTDRWAGRASGGTGAIADALRSAAEGETERLGQALGEHGVRFVALVSRAAPERTGATAAPLPEGLVDGLAQQLDLRRLDVDPALGLFENVAWSPAVGAEDGDRSVTLGRGVLVALQAALWAGALALLWRGRGRRGEPRAAL